MSEQENHDVFSEESMSTETPVTESRTKEEVEGGAKHEAETQSAERTGAKASEQQGDDGAEPPAADGDSKVSSAEKMIPESRFKAAVKDVNDKLVQTQRELAAMKVQPAPDRTKDPDGYDRDYRIKMSRNVVSKVYQDYDAKIAHFQEMAKNEPALNAIVANHDIPAQMAYDLATKDMELTELAGLKGSDEWKEFQAYKTSKQAASTDTAAKLSDGKPASAASKVPNLNRNAPSVNRDLGKAGDDNLFGDHYSTGFGN